MKILRVFIVAVMLVFLAAPTVILAAKSADVNVNATPIFTAGILSFTITYVTDTQIDLEWTVDPTVDKVMVRAKYGEYPHDIPNEHIAPSDGYLVYYGFEFSTVDTSMNFDENVGILYYKAWAQKPDGHWYTATKTGQEESKQMILWAVIGVAGILTFAAIISKNIVMAIVGGGSWWGVIAYIIAAQPANLTNGSNAQQIVVLVMAGASIGVLVYGVVKFVTNRRENEAEINYYSRREDVEPRSYRAYEEGRGRSAKNTGDESLESYRARIRAKARPWEARRRA
jgi:hypothetical protein